MSQSGAVDGDDPQVVAGFAAPESQQSGTGILGLVADPYHGLAADYDWIFDDGALAGGAAISQPATARLLQRTGAGGDVLDAACGTGIDAAVLARRGFSVRAAGGSQALVEVAAARV